MGPRAKGANVGKSPDRRRALSLATKERLRAAILARRPWESSTGPRTPSGKARSSRNAKRHGNESNELRAFRRAAARLMRCGQAIRDAVLSGESLEDLVRLRQGALAEEEAVLAHLRALEAQC